MTAAVTPKHAKTVRRKRRASDMPIHVTKVIEDVQIHVLLVRCKRTENFRAELSCIADKAR